MMIKRLLMFILLQVLGHGAAASSPVVAALTGCTLVWSDEFEGDVLDDSKWAHRALGPRMGAMVSQDQSYLDGAGHLVISAEIKDGTVHTGMVATHHSFEKTFGYFETRVKLPSSHATRAAFWLQTKSIGRNIGHPEENGLEVDVFEFIANRYFLTTPWLNHALHWDGYGAHHKKKVQRVSPPVKASGWHSFSLLWTPERYIFFVDGAKTAEFDGPISQTDLYMILSLELVSPSLGIARFFPDEFLVDYVRVFDGPDCTFEPV